MKLTIKNIHKIFGRHVYSKWIQNTYGWSVQSVEEVHDTYYFQLVNNGPMRSIQIKLKREPSKYEPYKREFLYQLYVWSHSNGKWVEEYYTKNDLDTLDGMCVKLGLMLERVIAIKNIV